MFAAIARSRGIIKKYITMTSEALVECEWLNQAINGDITVKNLLILDCHYKPNTEEYKEEFEK